MTEDQLLEKYRAERPLLQSLGAYILRKMESHPTVVGLPSSFFVLPPSLRTKSDDSILQKAFYRGKNYLDPYEDITDKVGVRLVTLTVDQVHLLKEIVEALDQFENSRDRDFEEERLNHPTIFAYQSVHYILRPKCSIDVEGLTIPAGLPCELQLRTVLQHAYSELTHDTIYKPRTYAKPEIHRLAARSMALIETTDAIFCEALSLFAQSSRSMDPMLQFIISKYSARLSFQIEAKLNATILDSIQGLTQAATEKSLQSFLEGHDFILERVRERAEHKLLYRQPAILMLYYLAHTAPKLLSQNWPFLSDELDPIYADLGISRRM